MNHSRALIIFAKQPLPGRVKTRLSPHLPAEAAAEFYRCMLEDTVARAMSLSQVQVFLYYQDDAGAGEYFAALAPRVETLPQRGADLGERMADAFADQFRQGTDRVAIIGSDSPDLPGEYILQAFDLLDGGNDVVFGPAEDGGYYLLAMGKLWKELFTGLPWSSPELLSSSLKRAGQGDLKAALLPKWYDMDTCADLVRAMGRGGTPSAPLTDAFLRENFMPANLSGQNDTDIRG
ncbi:MAG TPA: TIGR04282 family arsenosugar biosynthesis glycosyltransferase [Geobacteraceae bacterium]|nr:TIGR04282 family arsenosugar biosynthesis glycosyltransferase [Geobacteraceae bacterium]